MTAAQQVTTSSQKKFKSEKRFKNLLIPYIREIVNSYRIGQTNIGSDAVDELTRAMRIGHVATANDVYNFDYRRFKTVEDEVYKSIALQTSDAIVNRVQTRSPDIIRTSEKWVKRTSSLAIANEWTQREADAALRNYLTGQRVTIAISEAQWAVETARKTAVISVNAPMQNAIEEIARLLSIGDNKGARRLSKEIIKLGKLPLSETQGELVRYISINQEALIKPITQARILGNLRQRSQELQRNEKMWQIFGFNVRDSHDAANGQTRPIDEPYQLENGLVQYPGDGSLGAALEEIINCHCVSVYL